MINLDNTTHHSFDSFKTKLGMLKQVYKRDTEKIIKIDKEIHSIRLKENKLEITLHYYNEAIARYQHLADVTNEDMRVQIEDSINKGLQKAFPHDNYEIKLREYDHGKTKMLQIMLREDSTKSFKLLKHNGNAISMIISLITTLYLGINSGGLNLYLFDEMLGGVDEYRANIVMDILVSFAKEYNLTIILVEHGLFPSIASDKDGIEIINLDKIGDKQVVALN